MKLTKFICVALIKIYILGNRVDALPIAANDYNLKNICQNLVDRFSGPIRTVFFKIGEHERKNICRLMIIS